MKWGIRMIKNSRGVTLVTLVIAIVILLILSAVIISQLSMRASTGDLVAMRSDIELLRERVLLYYSNNGRLPTNNIVTNLPTELNTSDAHYTLDIERLGNITLNFGLGNLGSEDIYIINTRTLDVYYLMGIEHEGDIYHSLD